MQRTGNVQDCRALRTVSALSWTRTSNRLHLALLGKSIPQLRRPEQNTDFLFRCAGAARRLARE